MKRKKDRINITVEKTSTGYSAFAESIDVYTTGDTITKLYDNLIEALNFSLEDVGEYVDSNNLKLNLDFSQFFKHYRVINAAFLAERIGMNATLLSQYVSGNKKPSQTQTQKIIEGLHTIGNELRDINLV